jgi:imidazolonepropionase-like amidohydrolase
MARCALIADAILNVDPPTLGGRAAVEVNDDRIERVCDERELSASVPRIDLGALTVAPGLIDCHTHLLARFENDALSFGVELLQKSTSFRTLEGAANARATLLAGFTTVRDVESEGTGYSDVALRDAIDAGLVDGPRMQAATRAIAATGGYFPLDVSSDHDCFPSGAQFVTGAEEARRATREQIRYGADLIKVYVDFPRSLRDIQASRVTPTLTVDEIRAICNEAHTAGRKVAAHATTDPGILNALEGGVDSIEHGTRASRPVLERIAERGVYLVPTLSISYYRWIETKEEAQRARLRRFLDGSREVIANARAAGVRIASGSDALSAAQHGANARELIAMTALGMTITDTIAAATQTASELLGLQEEIGAIAAGRRADLIAVEGNPLEDITAFERVRFVMKNGRIVKNALVAPEPTTGIWR